MRKRLNCLSMVVVMVSLLAGIYPSATAADFTPNPKTEYAKSFFSKCESQQWFINEIERLLNSEKKTINDLTGPDDFKNIKSLGLADKKITGIIPSAIGELFNLQYLFLSSNNLSGEVPQELYSLEKLKNIDLADNNFTVALPSEFASMPTLEVLILKNNAFSGQISEAYTENDRIITLNFKSNNLTGGIPEGISGMTSLEYLNLSDNPLGGEIPDLSGLVNLEMISLWNCGLSGEIPESLYELTELYTVDLAENELGGGVSENISKLENLMHFTVASNKLRGLLPDAFTGTKYTELRFENNYFRGTVPASLKARYDEGVPIYLMNNYLTGQTLKSMVNNEKNYVDGSSTEQYQLSSKYSMVQIYIQGASNILQYIVSKSYLTGDTLQKENLWGTEYVVNVINGDSSRITITQTEEGIFIQANGRILRSERYTIEIIILDNDGSEYSRVTLMLTTETLSGMGGISTPMYEEQPEEDITVPHDPYINGFPDGTFKPDDNVTRAQVAKMVITALGMDTGTHTEYSFNDVPMTHWAYEYIEACSDLGYMEGYPEGDFRPENAMTRAELAACLVRIAEVTRKAQTSESKSFSDVESGKWYAEYVDQAVRFGLITGYTDGSFRPNNTVSRAEAVTMINRLIGRSSTASSLEQIESPFNDLTKAHWAYYQVLEASVWHKH